MYFGIYKMVCSHIVKLTLRYNTYCCACFSVSACVHAFVYACTCARVYMRAEDCHATN